MIIEAQGSRRSRNFRSTGRWNLSPEPFLHAAASVSRPEGGRVPSSIWLPPPGGKTTQMAAMTGNQAQITACEKNKARSEKLKYNLEKQGAFGTYVMVEDARKLDDFFSFDRILLDAPCSGSGTVEVRDASAGQRSQRNLWKDPQERRKNC